MWCYQKPGFEALLLTELQRQQQCSQFCDTMLKAEGVSVPAHSCILSAISPHMSSALSTTPAPPAGQNRLLEFRAVDACTLLHMVRLLYSGEMAGEGEKEREEAISAAAKLGIHGLVEVSKRDRKSRNKEEVGQYTEVGVQTESLLEESEGRQGKWREVRNGSILLWKETQSNGGNDIWTQTEEQQINTAPPTAHPAVSFETIDLGALQNLGQTDAHLVPQQIVPMSVVYPPSETQHFSAESTAAGGTSVAVVAPPYTCVPASLPYYSSQTTPSAADPQSWWTGPQEAGRVTIATEEWEDERFKQFQGNIPGFISYFLNPDKVEGSRGGRAERRRGGRVGRPRSTGTGESRARGPRAGTGGRGRGGFTQKVDRQEVGVGKVQMLFRHRWGMRTPRTGQGGGAVGRKLYLKTREIFKPGTSCQRRRGCGKMWEFSQTGDMLLGGEGRGGHAQRGRKNTAQQFKQDSRPVSRPQRSRAKSATPVSLSHLPSQFCNVRTLPAYQPSPSTSLLSSATSYASPALSFLHTTPLPPPAPSAHDEQPEHIDRLLEEVMMGLDILPNDSSRTPQSQGPLPASGSTTGVHRSTEVIAVARAAGDSSSTNGDGPVLQQCEGELNEMLDHFLQSFEQHVESFSVREEKETSVESSAGARQPYTVLKKKQKNKNQNTTPQRAVYPKHTEEMLEKVKPLPKRSKKRKPKQYQFSLEKKKTKVRKPVSCGDATTKIICDQKDKQLQQIPVVHLERRGLLPVRVILQTQSCEEDKSPEKAKTCSSSVKNSCKTSSETNQSTLLSAKSYPIRSRFREAQIMDSMPFLQESPSADKPVRKRGRPRRNTQQNSNSSEPPVQPQSVVPGGTDERLEENQERHEDESTVQPQEEEDGPTGRGQKRVAESNDETDDATVTKRVCFEQMAQQTCATCMPSSESAGSVCEPPTTEPEEIIDVETVSLTSLEGLYGEEQKPKPVWSEIKLIETESNLTDEETCSSTDEIIDVEGDNDDSGTLDNENKDSSQNIAASLSNFVDLKPLLSPLHHAKEFSLESTECYEEDKYENINVIAGCSPDPEPVIISWTESSDSEEEERDDTIDVLD